MLGAIILGAYLLGAIPFAVVVGRRLRGVDVRHAGTGNTGAMNTIRSVGPAAGVLVALLDGGKAALAVVVGHSLLGSEAGALAGCAAVVGHCFSPYLMLSTRRRAGGGWKMALRRTGGKGLASGISMLLLVAWPVAVLAVIVFGLTFAIQRKDVTWPSVLGTAAAAPAMWAWTGDQLLGLAALIVAVTVAIKHLPDLREGYYVEAAQ
jgi:acyl phosphate:glycerol-3-phosphate acyltransferase